MSEEPLFRRSPFSDLSNDVWCFFDMKRKVVIPPPSYHPIGIHADIRPSEVRLRANKNGVVNESLLPGIICRDELSDGWGSPFASQETSSHVVHRLQIDLSDHPAQQISVTLLYEDEVSVVELTWQDRAIRRDIHLHLICQTHQCEVRNVFFRAVGSEGVFVFHPHLSRQTVCAVHEHVSLPASASFCSTHHTQHAYGVVRSLRLVELQERANVKLETRGEVVSGASWQEASDLSHVGRASRSTVRVRTVCHDQGQFICQSLARLGQGVEDAKTDEQIAVLLLNGKPDVRVRAFLHIQHDVVEGAHGASIGGVSPAALTYLLSRGLSNEIGIHLLKQAFLNA